MYIYTNPNPINRKIGDCVIRAIAIATETTWEKPIWTSAWKV